MLTVAPVGSLSSWMETVAGVAGGGAGGAGCGAAAGTGRVGLSGACDRRSKITSRVTTLTATASEPTIAPQDRGRAGAAERLRALPEMVDGATAVTASRGREGRRSGMLVASSGVRSSSARTGSSSSTSCSIPAWRLSGAFDSPLMSRFSSARGSFGLSLRGDSTGSFTCMLMSAPTASASKGGWPQRSS